jgi:hypothetical protein
MTLPKKKLLVILGAGSSMPCSMPSVANLDDKMKEWCQEWKPHLNVSFLSGGARWQVYNDLWDMIEEYYRTKETLSPPMKVNLDAFSGHHHRHVTHSICQRSRLENSWLIYLGNWQSICGSVAKRST